MNSGPISSTFLREATNAPSSTFLYEATGAFEYISQHLSDNILVSGHEIRPYPLLYVFSRRGCNLIGR
jgi:hypothetical protein